MSRRPSSPHLTEQPRPAHFTEQAPAPPPGPVTGYSTADLRKPSTRRPALALAAGAAVCLAVGLLVAYLVRGGSASPSGEPRPRVLTEEELLCERFMKLKNAGDPKAADLLGRVPAATDEPLAKADMDRLQTDFFLRDTIQVLSVTAEANLSGRRPGLPPGCLVLAAHGNVAAPTLTEKTAKGTERSQRTMSNPDLIVEVRDGKIYGVRAELHVD